MPVDRDDGSEPTHAVERTAGGRARAKSPRRVGHYRVESQLGRGGMGVVYRAMDERLHRPVALKALPADLVGDEDELARLVREARTLALVSHPNVATIHGMEQADGSTYLVLELVEGETLKDRLVRGALPVEEAVALCGQVAAGLHAVHAKGLVHRDLKTSNVMVMRDGTAKLLDFGLALLKGTPAEDLAKGDYVFGTSGWMSPEQLRGEELDARSDAWAWGCLLFQCLSGVAAFPGNTPAERDAAAQAKEPDWSRLPADVTDELRDLLVRCLSKDRGGRPATLDYVVRRLAAERTATHAHAMPRHSLPAEPDAFVGREDERRELSRLLESARLVSVLGLGGTGKTRLVLHHARETLDRWPGGAWFCDLSEARDADGIVQAVATALDVPLGKGDPVLQLGHAIAARGACLVVMDNFEQVSRHARATLGKWLVRASEAQFIVTTREVLGLPGEQSLALPPLTQEDAEALFVARARAARADFTPDETERSEIERLVALLDHLPLAIELAAARVRIMPPRVLLERMSERFKLLSSTGARHTRQATLKATLDWSWDLMSHDERLALEQLSVFEGGFTLEAAEAVLALPSLWPADAVQALADKSWVRAVGEARFDVLVSVQEYAAEKLEAAGGRSDAETRHGAFFAAMGSDDALEALERRGSADRRRALRLELDNLVVACRRAVARGDAGAAAGSLAAAWAVYQLRGPMLAGAELARAVLPLDLPPGTRARVERVLGAALGNAGRGEEARAHLERALALHREAGERRGEGNALAQLGIVHIQDGRVDEARAAWEAALALFREIGYRHGEGSMLSNLGVLHSQQGRVAEARALDEAALALARELGDGKLESNVLSNLGSLNASAGRREEARAQLEGALALDRSARDRRGEGQVLAYLASLDRHEGLLVEAHACYEAALAIHREVGDRRAEGNVLSSIGNLLRLEGRNDAARRTSEAALSLLREVGFRRNEAYVLLDLGALEVIDGRCDRARELLDASEAILRSVEDVFGLGYLHCERARLEAAAGRPDAARARLAEAERAARTLGAGPDTEMGKELAAVKQVVDPGADSGGR